jgi:Lrp/AsnC family transcriptional regulator for asnA, asnC and gidA
VYRHGRQPRCHETGGREKARTDPGPDQVRVRTERSAISPGTELLVYREEVPSDLSTDETIDALDGSFSYPLQYGYAAVGRVTAVGEALDDDWLAGAATPQFVADDDISPMEGSVKPTPRHPDRWQRRPSGRRRGRVRDPRRAVYGFARYFFRGSKQNSMSTESTEKHILSVLEDDAQASYAEIAERVDVSKPTVRKYIQRLEEEGVIMGYSADVDPKKLPTQSIALVGLDVESERYVDVTQQLKDVPEIEALYTSSGDHMLMAEVRAKDGDAVGRIIETEISDIDGVTAAHPSFLQERLK